MVYEYSYTKYIIYIYIRSRLGCRNSTIVLASALLCRNSTHAGDQQRYIPTLKSMGGCKFGLSLSRDPFPSPTPMATLPASSPKQPPDNIMLTY